MVHPSGRRALTGGMRAIVHTETGPAATVLRLVEREAPEPAAGEVRVRVVLSGVNPTDWKSRAGERAGDPLPFPEVVPDQDGAGVVDAVGEGVHGLAVGDRVWTYLSAHGRPTGTAQEFTVLPASRVVPLPAGASFEVGASLGVPAMTAHRALTVHEDGPARLAPGALAGRTVLVSGGAGAVGHAAVQLATWAGATVVTTVSSPEKAALARAAGARHVVDYRREDVVARVREVAPDGVDVVVEVALAANAEIVRDVVATRGVVAVYADDGGAPASVEVRPAMVANVRYQFVLLYTVGEAALAAAVEDGTAAVGAGVLAVGEDAGLPLHVHPLERTAEAHDHVEGGAVGKVLVRVADDERGTL